MPNKKYIEAAALGEHLANETEVLHEVIADAVAPGFAETDDDIDRVRREVDDVEDSVSNLRAANRRLAARVDTLEQAMRYLLDGYSVHRAEDGAYVFKQPKVWAKPTLRVVPKDERRGAS